MFYATSDLESKLWSQGKLLVCGVDEVGRGCFAGPVVAGAVILPPQNPPNLPMPSGLADSKLLKPEVREKLAREIQAMALDYAIGLVEVDMINQIGIGKATQLAFVRAIQGLKNPPDHILIDAFYINDLDKSNQQPVKDGDKLSVSIAAASIVAKVYRDQLMRELDAQFPGYGFAIHKGYGTKLHQSAIKEKGLCLLHRTSFNLTKFL
ncbi:ribonuclease HII [Candidatus Daviesbacteria bacterium RIFCSPHIGHO2_01_FULL_44_29]|uniref:Ribonuclease HII n=1 Tax=Candidatus Daviesbacteria bacterium RIFCSPHIGHO2_02_FULL_43_12 TaxID=1797776 RepID=A0A1F5KK83_9BACT|nr:MAG: ribonuclease HII [Candidatus Daviesbacteria bacterium RIFCSPHIGHO2_01_FULL_44_29]OGE40976.1 MAG: ribonuclease HII [Candidatus Daviesbacteria bacterium RIFCSPHIGHO2_12_FULL_47_45]OGE41239.1 MAG: ribonuclease HII [Candidatus Daviesbacteria bacterium RIFCSPHIGHO2_02_FULL_43_12]OGE69440.1 MAG: ribonuclease HII [Candidatus Daviesbacteria bacterium RIFCSPLOWO2_01_FULL_43_15]